jgi:hypothetical protein
VLLARNRQPPPTVAAGVPHAELVSLPSGLPAMVCEAIVKLKPKVRLVAACARGEGRRMHGACQSIGDRARH